VGHVVVRIILVAHSPCRSRRPTVAGWLGEFDKGVSALPRFGFALAARGLAISRGVAKAWVLGALNCISSTVHLSLASSHVVFLAVMMIVQAQTLLAAKAAIDAQARAAADRCGGAEAAAVMPAQPMQGLVRVAFLLLSDIAFDGRRNESIITHCCGPMVVRCVFDRRWCGLSRRTVRPSDAGYWQTQALCRPQYAYRRVCVST
jgi:hypothetical protein